MPAAYARHGIIIREACATYGGTIYTTKGDALQVAFSRFLESIWLTSASSGSNGSRGNQCLTPEGRAA